MRNSRARWAMEQIAALPVEVQERMFVTIDQLAEVYRRQYGLEAPKPEPRRRVAGKVIHLFPQSGRL